MQGSGIKKDLQESAEINKKLMKRGHNIVNTKESERAELHRTIWSMANDLRGSVDGWDFKQYVLGMLFYRYISENIKAQIGRAHV